MRTGHWAITVLALAISAGSARANGHPYAHFHHALWELRDARKELEEAKHDFGGHREKALHAAGILKESRAVGVSVNLAS
jgi:hypothetical protein